MKKNAVEQREIIDVGDGDFFSSENLVVFKQKLLRKNNENKNAGEFVLHFLLALVEACAVYDGNLLLNDLLSKEKRYEKTDNIFVFENNNNVRRSCLNRRIRKSGSFSTTKNKKKRVSIFNLCCYLKIHRTPFFCTAFFNLKKRIPLIPETKKKIEKFFFEDNSENNKQLKEEIILRIKKLCIHKDFLLLRSLSENFGRKKNSFFGENCYHNEESLNNLGDDITLETPPLTPSFSTVPNFAQPSNSNTFFSTNINTNVQQKKKAALPTLPNKNSVPLNLSGYKQFEEQEKEQEKEQDNIQKKRSSRLSKSKAGPRRVYPSFARTTAGFQQTFTKRTPFFQTMSSELLHEGKFGKVAIKTDNYQQLLRAINDSNVQLCGLITYKKNLEREIRETEIKKKEKNDGITQLEKNKQWLQTYIQSLKDQMNSLQSAKDSLIREKKIFVAEVSELRKDITTLEKQKKEIKQKNQVLKMECLQAEKKIFNKEAFLKFWKEIKENPRIIFNKKEKAKTITALSIPVFGLFFVFLLVKCLFNCFNQKKS